MAPLTIHIEDDGETLSLNEASAGTVAVSIGEACVEIPLEALIAAAQAFRAIPSGE